MTTSAAALPVLPPGADIRSITERLNALIRWFNRPDLFIPSYAADTGTGAAYVIAPSSDIKVYEVGQVYAFLLDQVNAYVSTQSGDVQDAWQFAIAISRNDPMVAAAATALDVDADALFRLAGTFT